MISGAKTRLCTPKLLHHKADGGGNIPLRPQVVHRKADGGGNMPLRPQVVQRWSGRRLNRCCIAKSAPFRPCSHCQKDLSAERKRSKSSAVHQRVFMVYGRWLEPVFVYQICVVVYGRWLEPVFVHQICVVVYGKRLERLAVSAKRCFVAR